MAFPQLPPSADPYVTTLTVNTKLRPYFEVWFQRKKNAGETPELFALRMLKTAALNDWIKDNIKAEIDAIDAAKVAATEALQTELEQINADID